MSADWDLMPAPIVVDARQAPQVERLIGGLEERGLCYLVQVAENMSATTMAPTARSLSTRSGSAMSPVTRAPGARPGTAMPISMRSPAAGPPTLGEVAAQSVKRSGVTLSWRDGAGGRLTRSQFVIAPVPGPVTPRQLAPGRPPRGSRRVLAEWKPGRRGPKAVWLTNLNASRLPDLIELITLRRRAGEELTELSEESGLRHFEGRSFGGWHHHVTLVSAAHAYRLLQRLEDRGAADMRLLSSV
jgi:hypothetical protein